jgi:hypothetical protein
MSVRLLGLLLACRQHIVEGIVTDALPVAETHKHTFRLVEPDQLCIHLIDKSQK